MILASCSCGATQFEIKGKPKLRVICHCDACKEFNQADKADIVIYQYHDVELPDASKVEYKTYTKPPMVQRGKCKQCGKPAVEYLLRPYAPKMSIVPTANIQDASEIPEVSFHSFYHKRVKDYDDGTKKLNGFLGSQLGFMWRYFTS